MTLKMKLFPPTTLRHVSHLSLKQKKNRTLSITKDTVNPGDQVVIILATGSEVRGFKPGWGHRIFSERKNPEYDFLRKGSRTLGPVS